MRGGMRQSVVYLLPAVVIAAFLIAHLSRSTRSVPPGPPSSPPTVNSVDPFDSIRTDLSDYAWPSLASRAITSSFAEYRRTHFHAGIDISTNDRTGDPVIASRTGYVSRITVEPDGYGKILFLRHPDGYTTAYAHLERFAGPIEERVQREQREREQYPVTLLCRPDEFPVKKGDVVAYSGDTGTGSPHLHFEIRDENQNPINPLLCPEFVVEDNLRPLIRRLAVLPLDVSSRVNGHQDAWFYDPRGTRGSSGPVITVQGTIGFAVRARDKSDASRYSHGIYQHRVLLDGQPIFHIELDRILFREPQLIALYYDQDLLRAGKGRFEKLYVERAHGIPFLNTQPPDAGVIRATDLTEGRHTFSVISTDFNSNEARVDGILSVVHQPDFTLRQDGNHLIVHPDGHGPMPRLLILGRHYSDPVWRASALPVRVDSSARSYQLPLDVCDADLLQIRLRSAAGGESPPKFWVVRGSKHASGRVKIAYHIDGEMLSVSVETEGIPDSPPRLSLREGTTERAITLTATDIDRYRAQIRPSHEEARGATLIAAGTFGGTMVTDSADIALFPVSPGNRGRYSFDNGRLTIGFDSLSVYAPLFISVTARQEENGTVYRIEPESATLRGGLSLTLDVLQGHGTRGLFVLRNGDWSLLRSLPPDSAGPITAHLQRSLTEITILNDSTPPWAGSIRVRFPRPRRPLISFRYGDAPAGVDYQGLKTYIDGTYVIPEIDGEHKRVIIRVPEPLSRGSHRLTIRLADNLGNAGMTEKSFTVR